VGFSLTLAASLRGFPLNLRIIDRLASICALYRRLHRLELLTPAIHKPHDASGTSSTILAISYPLSKPWIRTFFFQKTGEMFSMGTTPA